MEKATEVIPQRILSCVKAFNSRSARMSNKRQEASSEPVANASPLGKNLNSQIKKDLQGQRERRDTHCTALISDSWPLKVWVARPLRISQSLAEASHAPETNTFWLGPRERLE